MGKTRNLTRSAVGALALTAMTVAALWTTSFAGASHVNPEFLPGASNNGKDCEDNDGPGQAWTQLKVDPNADGQFSDGTLTVNVVHTQNDKVFDWTSNIGVDAVIAKGGSDGSYLYRYDPPQEQFADTGLTTPGQNSISHISFCYDKDPEGSLTVIKHVVNDDGGSASASNWTMNVSGPTPLSFPGAEAPGTTNTVKAGSYTVTESGGPSGYALSYSGDCDANGNVTLGDQESKTCTLTNDDQPATLIVKKVVVNDHGGQASADDFGFSVNGGAVQPFEADGQNELQVDAGTYNVTEPAFDGYATSYDNCSNVQIPPGGSATCTVTNDDVPGTVIVKKVMVGGSDTFDFSGTPSGSISQSGGTISATVAPGQYLSTEAAKAGWQLTSVTCDDSDSAGSVPNRTARFQVAAGETVTCTFTNSMLGRIVVEKQTNPDGDTQLFDFDASYDAVGFSLSDGQQDDSGPLAPGTYSVSENVPAGWDLASAVCSDGSPASAIVLALGETVTCVFTNEKDAAIVVEKQTDPDGHAQVFQFSASYDANGFSLSDGQQDDSGDLAPGTYSVSENVPAGWDLASAVCSDQSPAGAIELAAGETVTCVFTNTLKRGTIIVEKQTLPDGAAGQFSFSGDAAGTIGDNGQIVVPNLLPGTYTSTEAAAAGWNLTSIACSDANSSGALGTRTATFALEAGETVTCTFTNSQPLPSGQGAIDVQKSADPTTLEEPGGPVTFSVTVTNVSNVKVALENVVDDVFGDLDDDGGSGCFDVPVNLAPGEKVNCNFVRQVTGPGGTVHVDTVKAEGHDEFGNAVSDTDDARVEITPRLIDLVIVKDATSPTPLNGIVNYTLTVTNKGPHDATNVQVADPAPAGVVYLTASPSQGSCSVSSSLITCSLGTIKRGETVVIRVTARATTVGTHTNTATVTGSGGRETNPADNVDSAVTVVPAPIQPPVVKPKPKPKPQPQFCLTLTVTPKMIRADGRPDRVTVKVTAGKKRVRGAKVVISGAGIEQSARSDARGIATMRVNPRKAGLVTITAIETNQRVCGPKRIGVVGVFLPPLTG